MELEKNMNQTLSTFLMNLLRKLAHQSHNNNHHSIQYEENVAATNYIMHHIAHLARNHHVDVRSYLWCGLRTPVFRRENYLHYFPDKLQEVNIIIILSL
jgi:hypothetical protein